MTAIKIRLLTLFSLLLPLAASAGSPTVTFNLESGRSMFVQIVKPAKAGLPTFLLLPGVNRSLLANEAEAVKLTEKGYGLVTFDFSTQPLSVALLKDGEKPYFRDHELSLADLAGEVKSLVKGLTSQYGLTNLIPVSLSYTGAVSPYLTGFPLVIETVPMTSMAAENPQLEQYRLWLKSGELLNPIFGPGITRASLDAAYRQVWAPQVDSISKQFDLPDSRREDMIEGYTVLSRAVEGFSWEDMKLPRDTRRVFILAGNEAGPLLRDQVDTFLRVSSLRDDTVAVVFEETGHIIPSEQPDLYAQILDQISSDTLGLKAGAVIVTPSTGKIRKLQPAEARKYLKSL
jgi:hypothetical protein